MTLSSAQVGSPKPTRVAQLNQVKRALSRAAFTLCWLPTVTPVVISWAQGKTQAPMILFGLLLLWYLVEYEVPRKYSDYLSILLAMLILSAPVWEPGSSAHLWYAVTFAGAATEVLAALYAPWPISFVFIILTAVIEHFVLVSQSYSLLSPDIRGLDDWIGPVWLTLLGSVVAFTSHRLYETFSQEDRITESLETLKARDAIARALSEEHASQQRRLHETVLNTLASLVRKDDGSTAPLLARLRDEISQARVYQSLETPTSMSAILISVIPRVSLNEPRIEISEGEDVVLSLPVARDVRDAVAELIRNAMKHSGGTVIRVSWKVEGTNLAIAVVDDGVGLSEKASKGLGLGRIMPEILKDRGAKMTIKSDAESGTRVELSIPLHQDRDNPVENESPYSILEEFNSVGRLLLAAPALSVAALSWWLISPFQPKEFLAVLLILHVGFSLTASINPRGRGIWTLIAAALVIGSVVIFLISVDSNNCVNIGQLRWAANFLYGSTSLSLVFYAPRRLQGVFLVASVSGLFGLRMFLPSTCASALLAPAIALLGVFLIGLTLWRQANRWRVSLRLNERKSAELTRRRIERRLRVYRAEQWSSALDSIERYATAAASSLTGSQVQKQAHIEEERLRARIQLDPFVNGAFAQLALDLVSETAERGWTPTVTVVETFIDSQPIPDTVHRAVSEACAAISDGPCQITLYLDEDEECLAVVSPSLDAERAATQINRNEFVARTSPRAKPIRAIFDSSGSEKWLEIRRQI